jgi:hypothetical protein
MRMFDYEAPKEARSTDYSFTTYTRGNPVLPRVRPTACNEMMTR